MYLKIYLFFFLLNKSYKLLLVYFANLWDCLVLSFDYENQFCEDGSSVKRFVIHLHHFICFNVWFMYVGFHYNIFRFLIKNVFWIVIYMYIYIYIYICYIYIYIYIIYMIKCLYLFKNLYGRTWQHKFKSWSSLIAFHIALIPLGKVWIQLFSLQLWVNSRADWVLQPWWGN